MTDINWTNVSSFQDYMNVPNQTTGGWFWAAMIYLVFIITVISMLGFNFEVALIIGAFVGLFLSLFLAYAGVVSWWIVGSFVGIELFMFIYVYWSSARDG